MINIHEQFIVDEHGERKAVVIPYRKYEKLLEDLHDLAVIAERRNEKSISHKEMVKRLKKDGLL